MPIHQNVNLLAKQMDTIDNGWIEEFLVEGASFYVQLEELGRSLCFTISMEIENVFICRLKKNQLAVNLADLAGREINVVFAEDINAALVKLNVLKHSTSGDLIAVVPVGEPEQLQTRQHPRIKPDGSICFRLQVNATGNIYRGAFVEDISQGGIGVIVYTSGEIRRGTAINLIMELSKGESLSVAGKVMNCSQYDKLNRTYRVGILYTDSNLPNLQKIAAFVQQQLNLNMESAEDSSAD